MSVLIACKQAVVHARKIGPISMNRGPDLRARGVPSAVVTPEGRLRLAPRDRPQYRALADQFDDFRGALGRQMHPTADLAAYAREIERVGMLVERFGAFGNCGELSAVAFRFLAKQPLDGSVGFFSWVNGNHEFVVAGLPSALATRNWAYDPDAAPREWGGRAIWCDPWADRCFDTWKSATWETHAKAILKKASPTILTDAARRGTSFRLQALVRCGARAGQ